MNFISVKEKLPRDISLYGYLCIVLIPQYGGTFERKYRILNWNILDKNWNCENMIVTHWMQLEKPLED